MGGRSSFGGEEIKIWWERVYWFSRWRKIIRVVLALRECTVCHEIKKSACSEASFYIDGINPKGITAATVTSPREKMKHEDESDSDE